MNLQQLQHQTIIPGQYLTLPQTEHEGVVTSYVSGKGTTINEVEHNGKTVAIIVASILGSVVLKTQEDGKIIVAIVNKKHVSDTSTTISNDLDLSPVTNNLPKENDIVLVRITKLKPKQAHCEILSVESSGNVLQDSGIGANGETSHVSLPPGGNTSQVLNNQSTLASSLTTATNAMASELGESFKAVIRSQDIRSTDRDKVKVIECFKPGDIVRAIIISLGDGSNYYLSTAQNELGVIYAKSENGAGYPMFPIDWEHMVCVKTGVVEKRKCAKPVN